MRYSQILTVVLHTLYVDLVLIRFLDMGFNGMLSDPCCMYTGPTCGFGFNQIGGHGI